MSAADVFTWPSLCEGFGLPPLEAMACGTPVLTSNLSCMPEIVGDAAVQVDPYGPEDMAKGMLDLASNAALRDRYRQRGFERVKIYSWMQTARQTAETYKKALE
jgi:glycosyltransferase involved in cell wall biosynthesis